MARFVKAWPCLASALLVNLAFPPFNLGLLVLLGLAPWLVSLKETSSKDAFKSGWTFGFFLMLGQMVWMFSFVNRWIHNPALAAAPYLLSCAFVALYFGIVGWQISLCWRNGMPWAIPIVWAGVEVLRSHIPAVAFPWGLIATPLWPYPVLTQNAYFGSIYLVSASVVLVNLLVAMFLVGESKWRHIRGYVAGAVLLLLGSWVRFNEPNPSGRMPVTVGQTGADLAFGNPTENEAILRQSVAMFYGQAALNGSELLVLPEGIAGGDGSFPPKPVFDIQNSPPVLFGGQRGTDSKYQTAFLFDGSAWQYADKTRLVIFGEYVPFRNQIPWFATLFQVPGGDLTPGEKVKTLKVKDHLIGPILCFEGLFPDISYRQAMSGAEMLAVMSVDDWYMGTPAPDQLKAASVWRAVETGLPLVRAASTGHSFAVDPRGRLIAEVPIQQAKSFRVELPIGPPQPFQFFPVFPLASLASLALLPLGLWANSKRKPRDKS